MARLALGVAGGVIGYFAGGGTGLGVLQGFSAGYAIGGVFDPNQKVLGPRLRDLTAPAASYGSTIPYIEGAPRIAGVYIWASTKREVATTTTEGKGGPGVDSTTFTYETDVLIELAINRCAAIRRIWSNGKLVWSKADDADDETIAASQVTNSWRDIRFYDGRPGQLPDPTYEAAVGVGNAPAYRTRTTVMIEGLNLGNSGQLPALTFEVLSEAVDSFSAVRDSTLPGPAAPFTNGTAHFTAAGYVLPVGQWTDTYLSDEIYWYRVPYGGTDTPIVENITHAGFAYIGVVQNPMRGSSDVSCYVNGTTPPDTSMPGTIEFSTVEGAPPRLFAKEDRDSVPIFAKRGNTFVYANTITSDSPTVQPKTIKIFDFTTTAHLRDTDDVGGGTGAGFWDVAISPDETKIYGLSRNRTPVAFFEFDAATGTLLRTISIAAFTVDEARLVVGDDGTVYVFGKSSANPGGEIRRLDGSTFTFYATDLGKVASNGTYSSHGIVGDTFYTVEGQGAGYHDVYRSASLVGPVYPTLDQVVLRLCERAGLDASDVDVTALASRFVRSMAITTVSTTRTTIETLMAAYLFEWAESDVLRAILRGGAVVGTIPFDDLGVSDAGDAEPLPKKRGNDMETVARVSVRYSNVLNDGQDGLEQGDRLVTESKAETVIEIALGFTPSEAKQLADANTMDLAVGLLSLGPIALSRKYSFLEMGEPFLVTGADGSLYRVRAGGGSIGALVNTYQLVLDDATAISSVARTDSSYSSATLLRLLSDTDLEMLDIPILRDADDSLGPYAAVAAGPKWSGAQIDKSQDGTTFAKLATLTTKTLIGRATTALGAAWTMGTFDDRETVTVDLGLDAALSSYSKEDALAGNAAAYLIGAEIVIACTATFISPGVYRLSSLLRGERGTEWAIAGHAINERVVLLQPIGLLKVQDETPDLNAPRYYRATTIGKSVADSASVTFTDTGVALKPFAPVDLQMHMIDGANVLTWDRRDRHAGVLFGPVPMSEAVESYEVEIRNGADVLVDAGTVLEPSFSTSSLLGGDFVNASVWGLRTISGELVGVREDLPNSLTAGRRVIRLNETTGEVIAQSDILGQRIFGIANIADAIYVATDIYANTTPTTTVSTQVYKLDRSTLGTIAASFTEGTPNDITGLVSDGTAIWVAEYRSSQIRKLNASTLASIATYAIAGGPSSITYASGKLWITCSDSQELVRFDTSSLAEDLRVATVPYPGDVIVSSGPLVFVSGEKVRVHNASTGATVATYDMTPTNGLPMRALVAFGISVAATVTATGSSSPKVAIFSGSTGAQTALIGSPNPFPLLAWPAGVDGADLLLTGSRFVSGGSYETRRYTVAPANLSGYTATVWQNSARVGRGYPATLEL